MEVGGQNAHEQLSAWDAPGLPRLSVWAGTGFPGMIQTWGLPLQHVAFRSLHPQVAWHARSVLTLGPSSPNPGLTPGKPSHSASHWPVLAEQASVS